MNNWNSEMDLTNKTIATRFLMNYFYDLCGKCIVLMTSITCGDVLELKKQGKIDSKTKITIIDDLQSKDYKGMTKEQKEISFIKTVKNKIFNIVGKMHLEFIFKDIRKTPLNIYSSNTYDLIYADTCGIYTECSWCTNPSFLQTINKNGYFALTVLLNRNNFKGNEQDPISNPDVILLGEKSKKLNHQKLNAIANDIEQKSNGALISKSLIYYYNNVNSPMGICLFQKK